MLSNLKRPRAGPLVITALHTTALLLFVHGFLLTRVRLDERSAPAGTEQALPAAPRTKLVWILIDSLRYDFLVSDGRYSCPPEGLCHQGHMVYLTNLTRQVKCTADHLPDVLAGCASRVWHTTAQAVALRAGSGCSGLPVCGRRSHYNHSAPQEPDDGEHPPLWFH